jgi:hypothetical protein
MLVKPVKYSSVYTAALCMRSGIQETRASSLYALALVFATFDLYAVGERVITAMAGLAS